MTLTSRLEQLARVRKILAGPPSHAHFLGIAGVGMAGVAVQLAHRGFRVTGCDTASGPIADWLRGRGIDVAPKHSPAHITPDVAWIVRSPAVDEADPEIAAARARGLPDFPRGVVLPALLDGQQSVAVSGTHGKTTTTAMITQILRGSGIDASFCIGGEVDALGGVAGVGKDKVMVVEADESDGTVELYEPEYAVITNAELDHVDYFSTREELIDCLARFARRACTRAVVCADDQGTQEILADIPSALSYGLSKTAAVRGTGITAGPGWVACDVVSKHWKTGSLKLPIPGNHNIVNALGACAVALDMGVAFGKIRAALAAYQPARRRFEKVWDGDGITVISDYAHHPTEVRCLVEQARGLKKKRILAVFQPHRYSRTLALGKDFPPAFDGIDRLVLAPVYAASERPVAGGSTDDLFKHCEARANLSVQNARSLREAWGSVRAELRAGDLLLVIGAGDVEKIAAWAKDELQKQAR